jgi:hypothetical protein
MSFITWNTELINRLKTGSIPSVMFFGDGVDRSVTPYVVVKPIPGGDRKLYQIIAHGAMGTQDMLEEYIFRELPGLFTNRLTANDKMITVKITGNWTGPYVDEGDNTVAMSRDVYVPIII